MAYATGDAGGDGDDALHGRDTFADDVRDGGEEQVQITDDGRFDEDVFDDVILID